MNYLKKTFKKMSVVALATLTILTPLSCDEHEAIDNGIHIGYILCNDHSTMSVDQYLSQDNLKAVAVVFAEATDEHPTLAVMIEDNPPLAFCDSIGMSLGCSSDINAFDGFQSTSNMQNAYDEKNQKGSPLANYVRICTDRVIIYPPSQKSASLSQPRPQLTKYSSVSVESL